jgi:hypothetical protein
MLVSLAVFYVVLMRTSDNIPVWIDWAKFLIERVVLAHAAVGRRLNS